MIDIMFVSSPLVRSTSWEVSDLYTHSDHLAIMMEIGNSRSKKYRLIRKVQTKGWRVETLDENLFRLILDENLENIESMER